MQYQLHLNLQQTAALRTAISFWERNEVKDKAARIFESCDGLTIIKARQEWIEFTKKIVDEWNKDELPQILQAELIHLVRMTGQIIFKWYFYIKHEYGAVEEAINCIDKIKWTPHGTVDVVETFKSSWLENPNLDISKLYNFACRYVITDHINDLWKKIPRYIQNRFYNNNIYRNFNQHIQAYWKHCRNDKLPNLMRQFRVATDNFDEDDVFNLLYHLDRSTEENMLRLTIYEGHFNAMKYFWEKLTEQEREESVLKCARLAVLRWNYYAGQFDDTSEYKTSQFVEICIFLMNQMTNRDKKSFFNEKLKLDSFLNENLALDYGILYHEEYDVRSRILRMLLETWPWQELFKPILKDMLQLQDDDSQIDCGFLDQITFDMIKDHKLEYSKNRSLLREAWLIIPATIKRKIVENNRYFAFINFLIYMWDLNNLNLIINDPEIAAVRDQFIDLGLRSCNQLVVNDQFEKLDQLIEKLFKFDEEQKKSFKQKINPWVEIFEDQKIDVADKFLDWQSNTREERQSLKNNINHIEVCKKYINCCNFEALDKFLNWKLETLEERMKCKDHFKSDIFTIKKVYDIWRQFRSNIDDAKDKSSGFLDWVFESNEEIRCFKTEKLVNIEFNQLIIDSLVMLYECRMIDEFLSWCLLDTSEIERIKQLVSVLNPRPA